MCLCCVCMHVCASVCMHVCVCVQVCVCVCGGCEWVTHSGMEGRGSIVGVGG